MVVFRFSSLLYATAKKTIITDLANSLGCKAKGPKSYQLLALLVNFPYTNNPNKATIIPTIAKGVIYLYLLVGNLITMIKPIIKATSKNIACLIKK